MLLHFYLRSFSYTSHADLFLCGEFLLHISCWFPFLSAAFLHIPCWLYFYLVSFSYTSHVGLIFLWGVSLTHPMTSSFSNPGSFSYTPLLFSFLSVESLLNIPCCFIFIWGVSLTHPMLTLFLCGEFLLHIPR